MHAFTFITLLFLLLSQSALAQPLFQRSYGGDANPTFTVPAGTGFFSATTDPDLSGRNAIYLFRTDAAGDTLWTQKYTHPDGLTAQKAIQTSDGGFAICGFRGLNTGILLKTDANGDELWCQSYLAGDQTEIRALKEFPTGGFAVTGSSRQNFDFDLFLMRTDAQGNSIWMKRFGGQTNATGWTLDLTPTGDIIAGGDWEAVNTDGLAMVMATDSNGTLSWAKTYDSGGYATLQDLNVSSNGDLYATGSTEGNAPGESGMLFLRLTSSGDTLLTRSYGWLGYDEGRGILENADGSFAITGVLGLDDSAQVALVKVDAMGQVNWFKSYEKGDYMESYSIAPATGGYLVSASDEDQNGPAGAYLFRTDANGETGAGLCNEISRNVSTLGGVVQVASIVPGELTGGTSAPLAIGTENVPDTLNVFCIGTSVEPSEASTGMQVYPQPLTGRGRVKWTASGADGECRMEAWDLAGRRFSLPIQRTGQQGGTFEAEALAPGMYGFQIVDAAGQVLGNGRFLRMRP